MNPQDPTITTASPAGAQTGPWRFFVGGRPTVLLAGAALALAFGVPLYRLAHFAVGDELFSHILLIPVVSGYLIWLRRQSLPVDPHPARPWAWWLFAPGVALYGWYWLAEPAAPEDSLAIGAASLVLCFGGTACLVLGKRTLQDLAFPLGLLIFVIPFPSPLRAQLESWLQHSSAVAAYGFFKAVGTSVFNRDTFFQLPGFSLEVAPECSGIHSTLALFITSLPAGYLFLRSPWRRAVLTLAVIPLAILRNGFRIFTIGELCVHVGPEMINSPIHRRGGPLFFALSLIPLFLLLFLLIKSERRRRPSPAAPG